MSNKLFSKIFSNARKPEGFFGRMMVNGMNGGSHARMAQWGLSFIDVADELVSLYDMQGRMLEQRVATGGKTMLPAPARGVYLLRAGTRAGRKMVVN